MNNSNNDQLTLSAFKDLWEKDLLPSIKQEIRAEIKAEVGPIKQSLNDLTIRCSNIEQSQQFISHKRDEILTTFQQTKKQIYY
jgi:hypothetical protein